MKPIGLFACLNPPRQTSSAPPAAPTLASFGNKPDRFAKEMVRHFGGDMAKLHAHVAQLPKQEQKAVIDGSEALRDFLGIRNPDGFRKRVFPSGSSSSRIPDSDAPAALAIAATCSGKNTRVLRSLTRLDEILKSNPPSPRASDKYQQSVETAFGQLLQEFHELRPEAAQQKAVELIERHLPHLDPGTRADIRSLARDAMGVPGISNELKTRLHELSESGGKTRFGALHNMEESSQPKRADNRGKANFAAILRNSDFTCLHGKTAKLADLPSNSAAFIQHSSLAQTFSLKKAKSHVMKDPTEFFRKLEASKLRLTQASLIAIAHSLAENHPYALAQNIQKLEISDESVRMALARRIEEEYPDVLAKNIQHFEISDQNVRMELAGHIEEVSPYLLAENIQHFEISDQNIRTEWARRFAEEHPSILAKNIQNFGISDESVRIELALISAAKSAIDPRDIEFEKFEISDQFTRASIYAAAYLNAIGRGKIEATSTITSPGDSEPMSLTQAVAQFGCHHPVIDNLLKTAEQQTDPHLRETLSPWANLVSLRFAGRQMPEADWQNLKTPLEAIWKLRAPTTRYSMTGMLAQQCRPATDKNANGFLDFCKQFTKPHTHLYSIPLFSIFESATDSPTLKSLVTLLHRQEFKDAKRQKAMVNSLMALAQADRIPDELKHKLLQAALPSGSGKDAARALAEPASIIECLALLAQQDTTLGNTVLERLASIQNPDDFNKQMEMLFNELFQLQQPDAQKVREQFNRYWEQSRQPAGLLIYAARIKMNEELDEGEKKSVLEALSQFVNAVVFSPEPKQTFRLLRYDPATSDHLHTLADKAWEAFTQWQRKCIHQPSDASLAQQKQFRVVDTDAAEDLFLCGTEVASCQSIHGGVFVNKELMGYVLDGKYRMLAIKSADERLMGRRMLRLLWDEEAQQPVLHLEKPYQNPGLPEKYQQALVELAWQKAQQMGCKLVSHDDALKSDGDYDGTLKANPTPWPFEYVDAQGLGVQAGRNGYELSNARIVAKPY